MDIISNRFPEVYSILLGIPEAEISVYHSKTGLDTFDTNGKRVHSGYDPAAEAVLQAGHITDTKKVTVFGIGFGYLITHLLDSRNFSEITGIILNRNIFLSCLKNKEMTFLKDERFHLKYNVGDIIPDNFAVVPPLLLSAEKTHYSVRDKLRIKLREGWSNKKWEDRYKELNNNMAANNEFIKKDPPVSELIEKLKNQSKPVMIIGAGPSIDKYIHEIKNYSGHFFIIALDAIYPQLVKRRIHPDIVVVLESNDQTINFFSRETIELTNQKTKLIYFPTISPKILQVWPNKRYLAHYYFSRKIFNVRKEDQLETQGSVIHPMLDFCKKTGVNNLVLAGIDFSFPGRKFYADGTPSNFNINEVSLVKITSWNGGEVESQQNYIEYLRDTEDFFRKNPQIQVYNISEVGAFIDGTKHMKLIDVVKELNIV